ncbi:MAG: molybdenum cofactor cytidylyltransferase [Paraglaciecola sp.]|jgi:molybdenum cofactor cytidylyltransferase
MKIQALLLAAGQSKRFNGVKQLAQISGQSMLNLSLSNYMLDKHLLPELDGLTVVLGANADIIQQQLASNIDTFRVMDWQQGMGRSISAATTQLDENVTHVLIGLADQIAVKAESFRLLLNESKNQPDKIITAYYAQKSAVPAIFPRQYFAQLMALSGDTGAKKLLLAHREQSIQIAMPEAAIDIDSKDDLTKWLKNSNKHVISTNKVNIEEK